ncbi:hypothetical protein SUNI508_08667 [Seiridium unicorne]|uniref:Uncharacterized protein n=1 Tax=Seiridium unicorne TaxID=138068 RepID=A0ABR2USY9_9PEZI
MTDKRRGASSNSHAIRSTASSRSSSSIIAPPPRAQLGNSSSASSSAGPDNDDAGSIREREGSIREREGGSKEKDSASTAALLKEKDEKIAELKRGLVEIEAEFARQVERLSQNESETAAFWQSKHSALNQQFLRTDTELRLLRAEIDVREGEREELKEGWDFLKREIKTRDDEIRRLRADLMGLKKWLSTSTRTDEQESDDLFAGDMARLGNGLQEWAIQHFRRTKIIISKASQSVESELSQLVPMYADLARTSKLPLLQSIVSTILVEMIFDSYFVGLSKDQATNLKQTEECLASLSGDESANHWRAVTLTMVRKEASQKLQAETAAVIEDVVSRVNRILNSIADVDATDARDQALRGLVNTSVELARRLTVQKAAFRVTMPQILPHQKTVFDPSEMEDIGGEDEDSLGAREICCVTFPSVVKSGDEQGFHPHFRNIVSKARVLCSPE